MALTRQKKEEVLSELKNWIKDSSVVVFVNFHGLNTLLSRELRSLIKQADAKYLVAKKTLIKGALDEFDFSGEMPELEGEIALVFGKDEVVAPAKSLYGFGRKHPEINLLGGVVDKEFVGKDVVLRLAKLPDREVLIAQFLSVISAPARQMVGVLQAPVRDFAGVLREIKK